MQIALYARISITRQVHAQTLDEQLVRLRDSVEAQGHAVDNRTLFYALGCKANLNRLGFDQFRDHAELPKFDAIVVTALDRLARKYGH